MATERDTATHVVRTADPRFVNRMKSSNRNVVIFYGSQTGTAEEFAGRLSQEASLYGMRALVVDPQESEMNELSNLSEIENSLAIFCLATYGEGDPTDNAQEFYNWLQNDGTDLTGLNYAVFALGNTIYEDYNSMGIFVDKRLEELGAKRVFEIGLGDDDGNIEEDFVTWCEKFWPSVCEQFGVHTHPLGDEISMRQYSTTVEDAVPFEKVFTGEVDKLGSYQTQRPYEAGDRLGVYPVNDSEIVARIGRRLKVDLDRVITLTNQDELSSKKHPFPCPFSYRTALSHYLDITCPPRKHVLKALAQYALENKQKEFLATISANTSQEKNPYLAPISLNSELHTGGNRSCMHIVLDITGSQIKYEAGDRLGVYPVNDSEIVARIGRRLKVDLDRVITLTNQDELSSKKHPFPCPFSYRTALSHYLDITCPPRKHVLKALAQYALENKQKEFLATISANTSQEKTLYRNWITKDRRNILAVLEDLPSVQLPMDHLVELLPRLQARFYSISSSPKLYPKHIHITAALVDYITPIGRRQKGVSTRCLSLKKPTQDAIPTVPIFVLKSPFHLPPRASTPVIMIGPGTGLGPFRGFIQERDFLRKQGETVGDTVLYFGCRHKNEDFIYQAELEGYEKCGSISKLHVAFSRDGPKKVYVQHLMAQHKRELWELLQDGAYLYICGDARNMAHEVREVITQVAMEYGDMDRTQAEEYVRRLQSKGRYSSDVWSYK